MTYSLKYFFQTTRKEHTHRLEIYQKIESTDPAFTPKFLGTLCAWELGLVGSSTIIDPIIKTECSFSFIDAPDRSESIIINGTSYTCKNGNFEEFYTSDSTMYKVVCKTDGVTRWTGFITPDSWSETLDYHSSVGIVARDNIGHLQDMTFDLEGNSYGMVKVGDIISTAVSKTEGMTLTTGYSIPLMAINSTLVSNVLDTYLNIEALQDKNWYEVLESVLDSLGLVLRWNDNNNFIVADIAHLEDAFSGSSKTVTFANGGSRQLDPAYKRIIDQLDYESGKICDVKFDEDDYIAGTATIATHTVSGYKPKTSTGWNAVNVLTLNPFKYSKNPYYGLNFNMDNNFFLPLVKYDQHSTSDYLYKDIPIDSGGFTLRLSYKFNSCLYYGNDSTSYLNIAMPLSDNGWKVTSFWTVMSTVNGVNKYYNEAKNKWENTIKWNAANCESSADTDLALDQQGTVDCLIPIEQGITNLRIMITGFSSVINYGQGAGTFYFHPDMVTAESIVNAGNCYGRISDLSLEFNDIADYTYNKTTTIYNDNNNVVLNRNPKFGQTPQLPSPKVLTNGIYLSGGSGHYPAAVHWSYIPTYNTAKYNLAVWIAEQILTFYHSPLSILSGDLIDTLCNPKFNSVWVWKQKKFTLVGGMLDFITGRISGAALREICKYEDIWDNQEGEGEQPGDVVPADKKPEGTGTITVSPTSVALDYNGQSFTIAITSTGSETYSIVSSDSWLELSATSGTGNMTLTVNARVNSHPSVRRATIMIGTKTVQVSQTPNLTT